MYWTSYVNYTSMDTGFGGSRWSSPTPKLPVYEILFTYYCANTGVKDTQILSRLYRVFCESMQF